jgi:hypothetical protein
VQGGHKVDIQTRALGVPVATARSWPSLSELHLGRQGRQMADLPALATDRPSPRRAAAVPVAAGDVANGRVHRARPAADPLWDLQDRPPPRRQSRRPPNRATGQPAHLPAHRRRAPARGRRRGQRDPRLARHADLTTTNRYAEINTKAKQEALLRTEPPDASVASRTNPTWRSDETLLNWLESLSPFMWPIVATPRCRPP